MLSTSYVPGHSTFSVDSLDGAEIKWGGQSVGAGDKRETALGETGKQHPKLNVEVKNSSSFMTKSSLALVHSTSISEKVDINVFGSPKDSLKI